MANSMFGCLNIKRRMCELFFETGFVGSRFCCKPIAALITAQGRDILQKTVDLVQGSMSLNVWYFEHGVWYFE